MNQQQCNRDTFLSLTEIIQGAAQRCLAAEAELRGLADASADPVEFAWEQMADCEQELAELLEKFSREGPRNVLDTRAQYIPATGTPPSEPTTAAAGSRVVSVNHEISDMLQQVTDRISSQEVSEDLEQLGREFESLAQRISIILVTAGDV